MRRLVFEVSRGGRQRGSAAATMIRITRLVPRGPAAGARFDRRIGPQSGEGLPHRDEVDHDSTGKRVRHAVIANVAVRTIEANARQRCQQFDLVESVPSGLVFTALKQSLADASPRPLRRYEEGPDLCCVVARNQFSGVSTRLCIGSKQRPASTPTAARNHELASKNDEVGTVTDELRIDSPCRSKGCFDLLLGIVAAAEPSRGCRDQLLEEGNVFDRCRPDDVWIHGVAGWRRGAAQSRRRRASVPACTNRAARRALVAGVLALTAQQVATTRQPGGNARAQCRRPRRRTGTNGCRNASGRTRCQASLRPHAVVLRVVFEFAQAKRFHKRWYIDAETPPQSLLQAIPATDGIVR